MRLAIILLFLACNCFSQNIFRVIYKTPKSVLISRSTIVEARDLRLAEKVLYNRSETVLSAKIKNQVVLQSSIVQPITAPELVPGGYNYLKTVRRELKTDGWRQVAAHDSYNGIHHIISKSVLEDIYKDLKRRAYIYGEELDFTFDEFQNNSPAVFHPYHNVPEYGYIFHNLEKQRELYYTQGIKACILNFFEAINEVNLKEGLTLYNEEFINTTILEASLWAKRYGLYWKMQTQGF